MITLSVIIPTKDREKDLLECIDSISNQSVKPSEVLVVDDGQIAETTKERIKNILSKSSISFRYFKKDRPGQSLSRNLGAKEAGGNILLFLDDDIVLKEDYIQNIITVWEKKWDDKKLAGVSGIILNNKKKSLLKTIFEKVFFLHSSKKWSILPWGFNTHDFNLEKEEITDWIPGGLASFRKEIFNFYQFKQFQPFRTSLEDVEICWNIKKGGYYFIVTPFAKLIHSESIVSRESFFLAGLREGTNRKIIFGLHSEKNVKNYFRFCVAAFGCMLAAFLGGHFGKGLGMIKGYLKNRPVAKQD